VTTKTRLQKAERAHKERKHGGRGRVFVCYEGQDFGTIDGVKMPLADFEATRRNNDTVLRVSYKDGEKVTDFGGKQYRRVSPLDWDNPEPAPG
jgi:hypothetical protein